MTTTRTQHPATHTLYRERMLKVLTHVRQHLDEPLPVATLARVAHFSPYHFHHIFAAMVGEGVAELVRRLRLERAARRLRETDEPVVRVALSAGYDTHEAFTRAFGAAYGLSPSAFRRDSSLSCQVPAPSHVHYTTTGNFDFIPMLQGDLNMMDVRIERVAPLFVAYIRGFGPYAETLPKTWQRMNEYAATCGLQKPGVWCLTICNDDPDLTKPDEIRGDACYTVDDSFVPDGDCKTRTIPEGTYAVYRYKGPYSGLKEAWTRLCGHWIPRHGLKVRNAPCFEVYRSDPRTAPQEECITEIYEPVHAPVEG